MGKFLKILRYIANLIATMGKNQSKLTNQILSINSSSDFKPDKPVWDEIMRCSNFKISIQYPSIFDAPLRLLKTERNGITGDIICWSVGQSLETNFQQYLLHHGCGLYLSQETCGT